MNIFVEIFYRLILKIFLFVIAGFIIGKFIKQKDSYVKIFVNLVLYVLVPVMIFLSLWAKEIVSSQLVLILVTITVVICLGLLFAWLFAQKTGQKFRNVAMPITFMNSGYLGIPVCGLLFGHDVLFYAILYDVVVNFYSYTVGIYIVAGNKIKEIFSLPLLYTALLGLCFNFFKVPVPQAVLSFQSGLNFVTLPLMLVFVGYKTSTITGGTFNKAFAGAWLRIIAGFTGSYLITLIFGITGPIRAAIITSSAMPSAILSYIFAEKYDSGKDFASATVLFSTLISLLTIPIIYIFFK
jgi:hypothetical protein